MTPIGPKLVPVGTSPLQGGGNTLPPQNQDILALVQWIDTVCGTGASPGALDVTSSAMQQGVAASDVTPMTAWLADPTDGPSVIKAQLQSVRTLLGELAQDRAKLAQPAPASPPTSPATPAASGTQAASTTVTVSAAQAVGMSAGAFVLGGLLGGAVMHHVSKKKARVAREDDDDEDEEERGTHAARETRAPARRKPAATPAAKEGAR
jgi:hypothetical protein